MSDWPAPVAEPALHGPAGEFVLRTEPHSEAHPMALLSLPRAWTDAADVDPFVGLAAGRSPFRVDDLVALAGLIDGLRGARV
jgi:hypothetical protein